MMTKVQDALFPFQREDVDYLADVLDEHRGAFCFNDMGTGKTFEALALIEQLNPGRVLIVCPNSLTLRWRAMVQEWLGEEFSASTTIVNYEAFQSYREQYYENVYHLVILDEAHRIRNFYAQTSRNIRELRAPSYLFLSGTPVVNSPLDLYPLFRLAGTVTGSVTLEEFEHRFVYYKMIPGRNGGLVKQYLGGKNMPLLRDMIVRQGVDRRRRDVLHDLPARLPDDVWPLDMQEDQRQIYDRVEADFLESGDLSATVALRQICCDPDLFGRLTCEIGVSSIKSAAFVDYVRQCGKEQFVVFSTFEEYVTILCDILAAMDVPYVRYTGKENLSARNESLRLFKTGKVQACVGTMQSMGEGVDGLQVAPHVLLSDRWWSPAVNEQAISRLDRHGQQSSVDVTIFEVQDSIDEALGRVLSRKAHVASQAQVEREVLAERMRARTITRG